MSDETKSLFGSREAEEPPAGPPLSRWIKLSYSVGEIGIWSASLIVGFYLNPFFLEVAGLDAILVRPSSPANATPTHRVDFEIFFAWLKCEKLFFLTFRPGTFCSLDKFGMPSRIQSLEN
jgi:hypothetical protein